MFQCGCLSCCINQQPAPQSLPMNERTPLTIAQPRAEVGQEFAARLAINRPAYISDGEWKEHLACLYRYVVTPMAGINGMEGGQMVAEHWCGIPHSVSWLCGGISWIGFTSGFFGASLPEIAHNRSILICSGLNSLIGAIPSAALTTDSMPLLRENTFTCISSYSFEFLDYLFAGANGVSNCILGLDEGHQWGLNFQSFYRRLMDRPVTYIDHNGSTRTLPNITLPEKAIMVFCGLVIAYCAATSVIGYVPSVVHLMAKFAPPVVASSCGILANIAEWMFMTNMMFTQNPEKAWCWNFASPIPEDWREYRVATALAVGTGLMTGLAMASFTFATLAPINPILAVLLTETAWMGGCWTAVRPSYRCFSNPMKIVNDIHACFKPCLNVMSSLHHGSVAACCPV